MTQRTLLAPAWRHSRWPQPLLLLLLLLLRLGKMGKVLTNAVPLAPGHSLSIKGSDLMAPRGELAL